MSLVNQAYLTGSATFNVVGRIAYVPISVFAALAILARSWRLILGLFLFGGFFFLVGQYGGTAASNVVFFMQCRAGAIYREEILPVVGGVVRDFVNRVVCYYDAIFYFPYGWWRRVLFPIMREGGFGAAMSGLARFFQAVGTDMFVGYFFNRGFLTEELDFANMCAKWQEFWVLWQAFLCYGCNDACAAITKLPIIPMMWGSDQARDSDWWCFWSNMFNGNMVIVQRIIYVLREIVFPTQPTRPRLEFKRAFDLYCEASSCFWRSWETAVQTAWDAFAPYELVWKDTFCFFDAISCTVIQSLYTFINALVNADLVLDHFSNKPTDFWRVTVKSEFIQAINRLAPAAYFAPVVEPAYPFFSITNYQLTSTNLTDMMGRPNPLYNKTTAADCLCVAITRFLCDPRNNGTTCAQRFAGTLLETVDPCCLGSDLMGLTVNSVSWGFELTLHMTSVPDFLLFMDRQPFSMVLKQNVVMVVNCLTQILRAISNFGDCIQRIVFLLIEFVLCGGELAFRLLTGAITMPFFGPFLPNTCNFITCPAPNNALTETLTFIEKLGDTSDPTGLLNCLCFVLNNGFNVPYAGCGNVTCQPVGFIPTTKRLDVFSDSIYNLTAPAGLYRHRITPLMTYGTQRPNSLNFGWHPDAKEAFIGIHKHLDGTIQRVTDNWKCRAPAFSAEGGEGTCAARRTLFSLNITNVVPNCTDPLNPTPNPPPCFNLCCAPKKTIQLMLHVLAMTARSINAGFQARYGAMGSDYWNGEACTTGGDCFQSDSTMLFVKAFSIVECLCDFIKLVLPPQGFRDPCCAFTLAGELMSCVMQIVINIGNSIAGDAPNFTYITDRQYLAHDFETILDIMLELFECACDFVRSIFSVATKGKAIEKGFDPCCIFRVYFKAILNIVRVLFKVTLALSTLEREESQCYLYVNGYNNARPKCEFFIGDLPIVQDFRRIVQSVLAPPISNESLYKCAQTLDLDMTAKDEGLPTCTCRLINALLAMVSKITSDFTGDLDMEPKCIINLCCPIYKIGQVYENVIFFLAQGIATLWQNWEFKEFAIAATETQKCMFVLGSKYCVDLSKYRIESFFIPQETVNFLFCDEYGPDSSDPYVNIPGFVPLTANRPSGLVPNPNGTAGIVNANTPLDPNNPSLQLAKCGKLEPAIKALYDLIGGCLCTAGNTMNMNVGDNTCGINNPEANGIANILDALLRWMTSFVTAHSQLFPLPVVWPSCACCGGPNPTDPGVVRPFGALVTTIARQGAMLIRNIPNPTFWSPGGGTFMDSAFTTTQLANNIENLKSTWINRILAPVADALCRFFTNAGCILAMVLGHTCEEQRYNVISSFLRYYLDAVIRVIALIEGAVKLFSQEQPAQCVGDAYTTGNYNRPEDQGTVGQQGQLVPTCSPKANYSMKGRFDMNSIGRIAVSLLGFIVDALIGFGRFSCSEICPGIMGKNIDQNLHLSTTCSCWNKSPYFGLQGRLQGFVCDFNYCGCVFNSGKPFACPDGKAECVPGDLGQYGSSSKYFYSAVGSYYNASSPYTLVSWIGVNHSYCPDRVGCGAIPGHQGGGLVPCGIYGGYFPSCSGGCTSDMNQVQQNDEIFLQPYPESWEHRWPEFKFYPQIDPTFTQPSGLVCVVNGVDAGLGKKRLFSPPVVYQPPPVTPSANFFSTAAAGDVNNLRRRIPRIVNSGGATFNESLCYQDTPNYDVRTRPYPYHGACYAQSRCGLTLNESVVFGCTSYFPEPRTPDQSGVTMIEYQCGDCRLASRGLRRDNLQGAWIQPVCERESLCTTERMCRQDQLVPCSAGDPKILDGVVVVALKYMACLMQKLFGNFPTIIFKFLLIALSFVWQIAGGIIRFVVAVVILVINLIILSLNPIRAIGYALPEILYVFTQFGAIFVQPVVFGYRTEIITNCIDQACFCEYFGKCTESSQYSDMAAIFEGPTNCAVLFKHFTATPGAKWTDLPFAERFQAGECIAKRKQGEFWHAQMDFVPVDFFYNADSWFEIMYNLVSSFSRTRRAYEDQQQEKRSNSTAERFEKRFHITEDKYLRLINSRGFRLRKFYKEELGMTDKSLALEPLVQLDMYYYKYITGYYGFLLDNPSTNPVLGTIQENVYEVIDAGYDLFTKTRFATETVSTSVNRYFKRNFEHVEAPRFLRHVWDGTLVEKLRPHFSHMYWPTARVNFDFGNIKNMPALFNLPERWTDDVRYNRDAIARMYYSTVHYLWPQYTTKEVHDRFIVGGNCRIVDGTIALGVDLLDYCLSEFQENIPSLRQTNETAYYRRNAFHNRHRGRIEWKGEHWKRPKLTSPNTPAARLFVHPHVYRRAIPRDTFVGSALTFLGDLVGIDIIQILDNAQRDFEDFLTNPSTDVADYPNVGARYWGIFMTRCLWPENLNCSIGLGLTTALWRVGLIYWIAFFALAFVFPSLLSALSFVFNIIVFFVLVVIVAWHYSPACFLLFPSWETRIPDLSMPLPMPLSMFPLLPMCLWDDILELFGYIFAECYTFIPASWLTTAQCVACDNKIGFADCAAIGISNPIEGLVYWGYRIFGAVWCDIMRTVPLIYDNVDATCNLVQNATPAEMDQFLICGIWSIGMLAWVILGLYVVAILASTVLLALIDVGHAVLLLIPTLPWYDAAVGMGREEGVFVMPGEENQIDAAEVEREPIQGMPGAASINRMAYGIMRRWWPHEKTE